MNSAADLLEVIRTQRLLEPEQVDEVAKLVPKFSDPRQLARELIQRAWLTPYQVNQLFQGKAATLGIGSYVILERLGEGGMGIVFKARNWKLGKVVALKLIRKEHVANQDAVRRFRREIEVVGKLSHPNIVMAVDAGQEDETHFFVMEYVDGVNLSALLKEHGAPPISVACDYVRQIASGLQQACERGMVHRDIKPANLLVQRAPEQPGASKARSPWGPVIKLLDMGVARLQEGFSDHDSISALTKEGKVVGTPDYMAPEQAVNSAKADIRADIYSLGCTFYHMLTGRQPYPGGTPMEKLLKHRIDQPTPIEQLKPEVPPALIALVRKAMAKNPDERFQTPAELAQALEQALLRGSPSGKHRIPMAAPVPHGMALSGDIPQAVPIQADGAGALAGNPFQFGQTAPPQRPPSQPASVFNLFQVFQERQKWPLLAGAVFIFLLGLVLLIIAIATSGPRR